MLFWMRGTLVYIGKKCNSPKRPQPTFQQSLRYHSKFQLHNFFNLRKSSNVEVRNFQVVWHNPRWGGQCFAFQTWSLLHSASEISSNRSIERLGFMLISVFQFFILQNWFCLQQYKTHAMRKVVKWADPFWPYRPKVE